MSRKNKGKPWESAQLNNLSYDAWFLRLQEIAINMYEWHNLPSTCDERYLEMTLFKNGFAVFFKDDVLEQYAALQAAISGPLNMYGIPINREAFGMNQYRYRCDITNSVIIYNNFIHTPNVMYAQLYAARISNIERTMDVNLNSQKTPLLIFTNEAQRLTMKNFYMQYDGNEPLIIADKSFDPEGIKAVNTQAPLVAPQLLQLKHWYFNEYLTFLGIENSNEDKKERMVADEVGANYGSVEAHRFIGLNARNQACNQINEMFGLNLYVTYRSNLRTLVNEAFKPFLGETIKNE